MFSVLCKPTEAAAWKARAAATRAAVTARLWDEADGVFWDRLPNRSTDFFVKVVTPASFWSMLAGIATAEQARAQLDALFVKGKLLAAYPMPCVGVAEPQFRYSNSAIVVWGQLASVCLVLPPPCFPNDETTSRMHCEVSSVTV